MTAARAVICLALVCGACESGELKTDHDAATSDGFVPLDGPVTLTDAELDASPADTSSPDVAADMTADLAVPDLDPDAAPPVDASPALDGPLPLPDAALVPPVMGPAGCNYELLERRPGLFHTVTDDTPRLEVLPLPEGASFFCMRVEFTMQTANNLQAVADRFEGCPIFSHIVGIEGTGPEAQNVGGQTHPGCRGPA